LRRKEKLMDQAQLIDHSLIRRTVVEIATLPDDDLAILLDIVALLKQQRAKSTAADIRRAARQRVATLQNMPREQLAAQFQEVGERIRSQAIAEGTAVEGDWEGD
jgi:phosphoserine phosphatase